MLRGAATVGGSTNGGAIAWANVLLFIEEDPIIPTRGTTIHPPLPLSLSTRSPFEDMRTRLGMRLAA